MKKILLIAVIQLFTLLSVFSQSVIKKEEVIQISKVNTLMVNDFTLDFYSESKIYILVYRDYQYTQIDEYKSLNLGNRESVLALKSVISDWLNGKEKELEIGLDNEPDLRLILRRTMGTAKPYVFRGGDLIGQLQVLNKAKMEKLFPTEALN